MGRKRSLFGKKLGFQLATMRLPNPNDRLRAFFKKIKMLAVAVFRRV